MNEPLDGAPFPTVGTAELWAALEGVLDAHFRTHRRIDKLERRCSDYYSSFPLEELDVRLDDGQELELVLKDLTWESLIEDARLAKPEFLYNPRREIEAYQRVLSPHRLGTPACYGAVTDERVGRYWLFLERVQGVPLWQAEEFDTWKKAARWLAWLHAYFAGPAASMADLVRYDGDYYRLWLRRAREFADRKGTGESADCRDGLAWLADRYERVVESLLVLPATFIHGEFYPSNILIQEQEGRICPVDWEMAGLGPGLMDLAALTAGRWSDEQRAALALAYVEGLPSNGRTMAMDDLLAALDFCQVHLSVQWLGWSQDWTPPPERTRDWLGDALRLAGRRGL